MKKFDQCFMRHAKTQMLFLILAVAMVAANATAQASFVDYPEAYAVYSAIIVTEWPVRVAKNKRLVIQDRTSDFPVPPGNDSICLKPLPENEARLRPLLNAYQKANKTSVTLQRKFNFAIPYELVSQEWIENLFKEKGLDGWKLFSAKYPATAGFISVSAVGFDADKKIALVYVGHSCGSLCGGGTYHFLEKLDGKWTETPWPGTGGCSWAS